MENLNHFDLISILSGIIWLLLTVLFVSWFYFAKIQSIKNNKYFLSSIFFKILAALGFSFIYLFYYQGGDTFAYWDGAVKLNNLFWESPKDYLWEMVNPSDIFNQRLHFNSTTGYPPSWIYKEPESFFVSKVLSFFSFITFNSYWATTIILATIGGGISWYFYYILSKLNLHKDSVIAFAVLFLPSVSFWCFGISKDTVVYLALILLCSYLVKTFLLKEKLSVSRAILMLFCVFLIYHIRIHVIVAMFPALILAFGSHITRKIHDNRIKKFSIRLLLYMISAGFLLFYIQASSGGGDLQKIMDDLIIIQQDFAQNTTYGDKRYTIFMQDYSVQSILLSIPSAILAAIYRPYIWEALNPMLLLNGLESLVLIYLTFQFITDSFTEKVKIIRQNELLNFSLIFILIMGFSVGFTSGLFGVLVRFKAVVLPFFILLIGISTKVDRVNQDKEFN